MNNQEIANAFRATLPSHKAGLFLSHNEFLGYYETAASYISGREGLCFRNVEERDKCIATDQLWELQWYPHTPVGFHVIGAPTLAQLLDFVEELKLKKL